MPKSQGRHVNRIDLAMLIASILRSASFSLKESGVAFFPLGWSSSFEFALIIQLRICDAVSPHAHGWIVNAAACVILTAWLVIHLRLRYAAKITWHGGSISPSLDRKNHYPNSETAAMNPPVPAANAGSPVTIDDRGIGNQGPKLPPNGFQPPHWHPVATTGR
jgi:hypothetical protein